MTLTKKHYIITAIVALMILTNPSRSSFASYLHRTGLGGIGREYNFFVFSIYSKQSTSSYSDRERYRNSGYSNANKTYYIGILGNFFKSPTL